MMDVHGRRWTGSAMVAAAVAMLALCLAAHTVKAQQTGDPTLRAHVEALAAASPARAEGQDLAAPKVIAGIYAALDYRPIWSTPASVDALMAAIALSVDEGLQPSDFHKDALEREVAAGRELERDILMTDALLRLLYQLHFGKVSPNQLDPNWNLARPVLSSDPITIVSTAVKDGKLDELIERARLKHPLYDALKVQLRRYRSLEEAGGWPLVADGEPLKPGTQDPRIAQLRQRLSVTGEYSRGGEGPADIFDDRLVKALTIFQRAHGLDPDGVLGNQTLAALNVTARERVDQIRVNLERGRWILRALGPDKVVVNIAGFYLSVVFDNAVVWSTRVIVGKSFTKTPIFTEGMKYVVFNPDWTVPKSIVRNEIFAKASANPGYLSANNYVLKNGSGAIVDPSSIDWSQYSGSSFPYNVVQLPGPKNALGLVKFLFPNQHSVYLHDTPNRGLFDKSGRTFSHGCIRVEDPLKLAEIVLARQLGWTRAQVDAAVATGKLTQVSLRTDLPVLLLYWTVDPTTGGGARFYADIYGRDKRLLKALDAPFVPPRS